MNIYLLATTLFAQFSRWERLGDGLHRSRGRVNFSDMLPYLIGIAIVATIIAVVVTLIRRNDLSKGGYDPQKLFRELCRAHGLDHSSRRLLRQISETFGFTQPAEVFVTPAAFEPEQLPQELQTKQAKIRELRERLFVS